MSISDTLVNRKVLEADTALRNATVGNVVQLCGEYLLALSDFRDELFELRRKPDANDRNPSSLAQEFTLHAGKALRSAIEITTRERNLTESLLTSFSKISGYEAVLEFNKQKFRGYDNWRLGSNSVSLPDDLDRNTMTIQEAVEAAGLIRRERFVASNADASDCQDSSLRNLPLRQSDVSPDKELSKRTLS